MSFADVRSVRIWLNPLLLRVLRGITTGRSIILPSMVATPGFVLAHQSFDTPCPFNLGSAGQKSFR